MFISVVLIFISFYDKNENLGPLFFISLLLFLFYKMFLLKVVRNFLKLFLNSFLVENFR